MTINVPFNGVVYIIPQNYDTDWGDSVTAFIVSVGANTLQKIGGTFQLTNDVNFGTLAGLISQYYKSSSNNIATTGILRLANGDGIAIRNGANSGNLSIGVNGNDQLTFQSIEIVDISTPQVIRNKNYAGTTEDFSSSFTLALDDVNDVIFNSTSGLLTQITLPSDSVVDIPIGSVVTFSQGNAGQIELLAGVGTTLQNPFGTAKSRTTFSTLDAFKIAANTWRLAGDFASS